MVKYAHKPFLGAFWMVFAGMCFALNNAGITYLTKHFNLHNTVIGFYQYFIAFVFMVPWILSTGLKKSLKTDRIGMHVVRVLLSVIGIQLWIWGLSRGIPISQAIALLMTSPIFVTIGSSVFLGEHVSLSRWFATLVGIIGSLIILEPWGESFRVAGLLPVAAALFWAGYSLMVRHLSHTESTGSIVVYLLILIAPFNLFLALPNFQVPGNEAWYYLTATGLLIALAQWALVKAYSSADASFIQPFDLVKMPLNILAGWYFFSEMLPPKLWIGSALLFGAAIFILSKEKNSGS